VSEPGQAGTARPSPAAAPGNAPWQQAEPPQAAQEETSSGDDALKKKIFAIGGGIVTVLLIVVGLFYIFGLSVLEDCSVGGATPIEVNQRITGEFTAFHTTALYEFQQATPDVVTVTARFESEIYIEVQQGGRPVERGVGRVTARLEPGTYQVMIRPYRQGSGSYTLLIATATAPLSPDAPTPPTPVSPTPPTPVPPVQPAPPASP